MYALWTVVYVLGWLLHWIWPLPFFLLAIRQQSTRRGIAVMLLAVPVWIGTVMACSGCPFIYLHQWTEIKLGWRTRITYRYEDSEVYRLIVYPTRTLTGKIMQ